MRTGGSRRRNVVEGCAEPVLVDIETGQPDAERPVACERRVDLALPRRIDRIVKIGDEVFVGDWHFVIHPSFASAAPAAIVPSRKTESRSRALARRLITVPIGISRCSAASL